jgi:predicted transcriptional regulator
MKAMTLRLEDTEYERLRTLAYVENRPIADVVREAISDYVRRKASHEEFRESLKRVMLENAELVAALAER